MQESSVPRVDKKLQCVDCQDWFIWGARDQAFYAEKQFTPPKRCRACRALAKEARQKREAEESSSRNIQKIT